ncbi:N-acetylmannosamine-6-phosphate 2-epimerase [Oxynema sp. CENA135]|uniref:N-acetylmannosamine-6-phosphate 2-epimerase n=1 Tax=Oxynema sp. CENA135 TaxID=984206 RepID=UPI00190D30AF|nr:N-acetylmannosamine-6-phosphate 2-epimerase [Oxynema sp. CENA135]MBK4729232.1 N-acetylmannosamine-6-phosphate 2-epimerase [Oxynema sp. CENA135]
MSSPVRLFKSLIVSCQSPVDSPLNDPGIIAAMARAAVNCGADGVRVDTPDRVAAVRQRLGPDIPMIGLWKQTIPGFEVYITPQFDHARAIADSGADIIAIDATVRPRPDGESVPGLIARIHDELGKAVMADVDTLEAAIVAAEAGADFVGTTLYGYTAATRHLTPPGFDLLAQLIQKLDSSVICEGGIASPEMAKRALDMGADAVVVGTDITGIDLKVQAYRRVL